MNFLWEDYLCHYGIKGMKWGVRRYQNPDGSLTAAGIERYGSKKGLKKAIKKEIATAKTNQDVAMTYQKAHDRSLKTVEKTKAKYLKTGKAKHLAEYMASLDSERIQRKRYELKTAEMKEHYNKLVKEFGKEAVSSINYENGKLKEKTKDGQRVVINILSSLAAGAGSVGMAQVTGFGVAVAPQKRTTGGQARLMERSDYLANRQIQFKGMKQAGVKKNERLGEPNEIVNGPELSTYLNKTNNILGIESNDVTKKKKKRYNYGYAPA